jgi:(1->4)-alpha-D-glucan 1-alpha-D-glucosylmutase
VKGKDLPKPRIPDSTYRLQFNSSFTFSDAAGIIPYLSDLGISDIYASPYLKAKKGSLHGYDIVDHNSLNPEIGTEQEYNAMVEELRRRGMGQILDIVPNHMCIASSENKWWMDVLENGPSSRYADFFDIDWVPAVRRLTGKLLIPILGDQYGKVLEKGELNLSFEDGSFFVSYYDHIFPVLPETYLDVLQHRQAFLQDLLCEDNPLLTEFLSILTALKHLPPVTEEDPERINERYREKEIVKKRLRALYRQNREIRDHVERNVEIYNGVAGDSGSFDLLDGLLNRQIWRLSHWRVATDEINYRRFFDINELAAIKEEKYEVFKEIHGLITALVGDGKVTGLRVDHTDGLYDPSSYFRMLQKECFTRMKMDPGADLAPGASQDDKSPAPQAEESVFFEEVMASDPDYKPFYIIGEKILVKGERMPEEWPIFSTTGYVFLNSLNGIFVQLNNAKAFDRLYGRFTGMAFNFQDLIYEKKKLIMEVAMSSEIYALGHHLSLISEKNRFTRDFTLNSLRNAIIDVIAFFPVYRTYVNSLEGVTDRDRQHVEAAVSRAKRRNPAISESVYGFLRDVLLLRFPDALPLSDKQEWLEFTMRFQQITGPVMAKGIEDTALYSYNRLVSLNEVGGMPDRFGTPIETFHGQNMERIKSWPHALIATSTHDTKRSEDVRARLNVLSEVPDKWRKHLVRWNRINRKKQIVLDGASVPERNEEYLLYQTLVGSWPVESQGGEDSAGYPKRIRDYMIKAVREAKVNSSWISINEKYEAALLSFIDAIMDRSGRNEFIEDFLPFQEKVAWFGMLNALSQTLLKIAAPGVPDFYQGTEIWDFSLVDPDNRRPVDFKRRREMLGALREKEARAGQNVASLAKELLGGWQDGYIKLYVTTRALTFRKEHKALFMNGAYIPLMCEDERKDHICAFARRDGDEAVLIFAPRFVASLMNFSRELPLGEEVWGKAEILLPEEIPGDMFFNVFTGEMVKAGGEPGKRTLPLAGILSGFPVAMLEPIKGSYSRKDAKFAKKNKELEHQE